jgi:hypothetical protein
MSPSIARQKISFNANWTSLLLVEVESSAPAALLGDPS